MLNLAHTEEDFVTELAFNEDASLVATTTMEGPRQGVRVFDTQSGALRWSVLGPDKDCLVTGALWHGARLYVVALVTEWDPFKSWWELRSYAAADGALVEARALPVSRAEHAVPLALIEQGRVLVCSVHDPAKYDAPRAFAYVSVASNDPPRLVTLDDTDGTRHLRAVDARPDVTFLAINKHGFQLRTPDGSSVVLDKKVAGTLSAAVHPAGHEVVVGLSTGQLARFDAKSGKKIASWKPVWPSSAEAKQICGVGYTADGSAVLACSAVDSVVRRVSLATGQVDEVARGTPQGARRADLVRLVSSPNRALWAVGGVAPVTLLRV